MTHPFARLSIHLYNTTIMGNTEKHMHISHLLWKHLNDELSNTEKIELELLFKENPEFKEWFNNFQKQKHIDKRLDDYASIDIENKWSEFYPRIKKTNNIQKISRYLLRVAAVLLPIAITLWVVFEIDKDFSSDYAQSEILPGSSKAVLTLSDGSKVKLQEETNDTLYDAGAKINSTGSILQYAQKNISETIKKFKTNTLDVPRGGEYQIVLGDGTKVWLNSDSKLKYLVPFGVKNRLLELSGEAYFEVAHNAELPFRVKTNDGIVTAIGTAFNVRAYENETYTATTLAEGKVSVDMLENELAYLSPGEQAVFDTNEQFLSINEVNVNRYLMWKNGEFMFVDNTLEDIINDLARWYDFEVFYENESIKDLHFTFYLGRDKGIDKILDLLQKTRRIEFEISDKHVLVKNK